MNKAQVLAEKRTVKCLTPAACASQMTPGFQSGVTSYFLSLCASQCGGGYTTTHKLLDQTSNKSMDFFQVRQHTPRIERDSSMKKIILTDTVREKSSYTPVSNFFPLSGGKFESDIAENQVKTGLGNLALQ